MRISQLGLAGVAIMGMSVVVPVSAFACEQNTNTTNHGGKYTVLIDSTGKYYKCNTKNQCLTIAQYAPTNSNQYVWENKSMTYSKTPLAW